MLDIRYVSDHPDDVRERLSARGFEGASLERLLGLATARRAGLGEVERLRAERNETSSSLASLDKKGEAFLEARKAMKALGARLKDLEASLKVTTDELEALALELPNLPDASVPRGASEADNKLVRTFGEPPSFSFEPKDHVALGVDAGMLDFERAAKLSGARFTVFKDYGARLGRALVSFMLDLHTEAHGYREVWPPALVLASALRGTGQLPKFAHDVFRIGHDVGAEDAARVLYLSPTAEVQLTNLHADEILEAAALPTTYCAYSPCFRSEAGAHGKDTRGLIRNHQFDKVELVHFCRPEDGLAQLEALTGHAEAVLQRLGLHYRVVELCTGDLGFSAQKTYDLEVWLPGQNAYREISSCSWCGDFQARRAKIRFRPEPKAKPQLVHTLNGSGLAVGRTMVALLEQGQQADGSIRVPEALQPYLGGLEVIPAGGGPRP